jgi:hypothetical protein
MIKVESNGSPVTISSLARSPLDPVGLIDPWLGDLSGSQPMNTTCSESTIPTIKSFRSSACSGDRSVDLEAPYGTGGVRNPV